MAPKQTVKYKEEVKSYLEKKIMEEIFPVHEKEEDQLKNIVKECVEFGTSQSVLILGLPGQGSTFLVNKVLNEFEFEDKITVVKLSGLLHTNDHLALKHIIQQLHVEDLEEDKVTGSFFDNLGFVLESFKGAVRNEVKPLVIILDQLEYFTYHKNQTLLYNLFDVVQSHQTAICVLAITKRIDSLEMLEKRVKSRFSPNEIYIVENCPIDLSVLKVESSEHKSQYSDAWNNNIEELCNNKKVKSMLQVLSTESRSIRLYKLFLITLLGRINSSHKFLAEEDIRETMIIFLPNEKLNILLSISLLELCLVIACSHHSDIYDKDPFNFEMIYKRFQQFCFQAASMSSITRNVVMRAFQRLESLGVIKFISAKAQRELQFYNLLYLSDDVQAAVNLYPNINTEVIQWATTNPTC